MTHDITLITTIAAGLGLALVMGFLATKVGVPPLVGYLVAGIIAGPATPGFVADVHLISQLAELGVMLMMFGVGLHFSLDDLMAVRRIAIPGAVVQIVGATVSGAAVAMWWGWSLGAGLVFGLALSVASTVVLLRALEARGVLESLNGRIAVGWLVVEDLVVVLVLVLLPALAPVLGGGNARQRGSGAGDLWARRGVDAGQGGRFRRLHADRGPATAASTALGRGPNRLAGALHPGGHLRSGRRGLLSRPSCSACRLHWVHSSPE